MARMVPFPGSAIPSLAGSSWSWRWYAAASIRSPDIESLEFLQLVLADLAQPEMRDTLEDRDQVHSTDGVLPAAIGPPLMKMVGTFSRTDAISMPGTILSQFGMQIIPSRQ